MNLLIGLSGLFKKILNIFHKKESSEPEPENEIVAPNVVVYRAVTKSKWWDGDEPKLDVFLRTEDEKDLSVLTKADCITDENCKTVYCDAIRFSSCHGEVGVKVESFNNFGFVVKETPVTDPPPIPHHASVFGMPPENEADARNIAIELLKCVTYKQRRKYKRKKS